MPSISGLLAFPITPADRGGAVDLAALRRLVLPLASAGVDAVGLLGSTGSYPYLTRHERRRALDAALGVAAPVPVLVGVGALRTDEAVALAADAKAAGAAAGLLAAVSYTPLGDDEVFEHFRAVAEAGLPLYVYDNPSTTHFTFSPALVGRLSRLDGVVAVKAPAPGREDVSDQLAALREAARPGFGVGSSVDWHAAEALIAGSDAWHSVAAGLFPARCAAITRAARAGDVDEARRLDGEMRPLWALFRAHTSLRVCFAAALALGLARAEPPRPLLPLTDEVAARVSAVARDLAA